MREAQSTRCTDWRSWLSLRERRGCRFLLDLLAGTNSLGPDFGRSRALTGKPRHGVARDDLAVSCEHSAVIECAGLSIKSDRQVTRAAFPRAFVEIAWRSGSASTRSVSCVEDRDATVLVTGGLAQDVERRGQRRLREACKRRPTHGRAADGREDEDAHNHPAFSVTCGELRLS